MFRFFGHAMAGALLHFLNVKAGHWHDRCASGGIDTVSCLPELPKLPIWHQQLVTECVIVDKGSIEARRVWLRRDTRGQRKTML